MLQRQTLIEDILNKGIAAIKGANKITSISYNKDSMSFEVLAREEIIKKPEVKSEAKEKKILAETGEKIMILEPEVDPALLPEAVGEVGQIKDYDGVDSVEPAPAEEDLVGDVESKPESI